MDKKITVNESKCVKCGLCIKDCVAKCLEFGDENVPKYKKDGEKRCIACQHCMAICPAGALSFGDILPENLSKVSSINSEDLLNFIKSRRSVRLFKDENIDEECFKKIKEMLPFIPTGCNIDSYHVSFVETKEKLESFRKIARENGLNDNTIFRTATAMIVVSVNKSISPENCQNVDPIIALSYIDLYAQSLGLGTLWCGYGYDVLKKIPEMYSLLEIPQEYSLSYVMLLGIPAVKYQRTIKPEPVDTNAIK